MILTNKVVMFMSADIVGATDFKQQHSLDNESLSWLEPFAAFFRDLPLVYMGKLGLAFEDADDLPEVAVWRVAGDEIVFTAEPKSASDADRLAEAFVGLIDDYDVISSRKWGLHLRGCCWVANLRGENTEVDIPEISSRSGNRAGAYVEYLGPDVDCGFRLLKHANSREVVVSLKLALAILNNSDRGRLKFVNTGEAPLKGLFCKQRYPIIKCRNSDTVTVHAGRDLSRELINKLENGLNEKLAMRDCSPHKPIVFPVS